MECPGWHPREGDRGDWGRWSVRFGTPQEETETIPSEYIRSRKKRGGIQKPEKGQDFRKGQVWPRPCALGHPAEVPSKSLGREKGDISVCFVLFSVVSSVSFGSETEGGVALRNGRPVAELTPTASEIILSSPLPLQLRSLLLHYLLGCRNRFDFTLARLRHVGAFARELLA